MTDAPENELVIVRRRRGGGDEGHHGGVWKIAFADFMTAMMAFFLVMWLVNMSDEETIVQIAAYFNPVQLSDVKPSRKGVKSNESQDSEESNEEELQQDGEAGGWDNLSKLQKRTKVAREQKLFENPNAALDRITGEAASSEQRVAKRMDAGIDGRQFGERIADPYNPFGAGRGKPSAAASQASDVGGSEQAPPGEAGDAKALGGADRPRAKAPARPQAAVKPVADQQTPSEAARTTAAEIARELRAATLDPDAPGLEIKATAEGVLISVTDKADFGMFEIGSAEPKASTVRLMTQLSKALALREGGIVLSGHTDARPYRTELYDNWRLSSARAHMAHSMLVRGGMPEARIERVEAYADKRPHVPQDRFAAQNRRVDVLLRMPAS